SAGVSVLGAGAGWATAAPPRANAAATITSRRMGILQAGRARSVRAIRFPADAPQWHRLSSRWPPQRPRSSPSPSPPPPPPPPPAPPPPPPPSAPHWTPAAPASARSTPPARDG